jgi:hypothetical protein
MVYKETMTEEEQTRYAMREYGFDIFALQRAIRNRTAWLESLPPKEAEAEALAEMERVGIMDKNGELTIAYR